MHQPFSAGRRILWRKWHDPLAHVLHHGAGRNQNDEDETDEDFLQARDSFAPPETASFDPPPARGSVGPAVIGPMGVIPLHESNLPSQLFNFWMGHANFDLTPQVQQEIARAPGVETLDVFTRYRFRLGVGKAFDQDEVKRAVELAARARAPSLLPSSATAVVRTPALEKLKAFLQARYPHWAIFVMPDGRLEWKQGSTADEVLSKSQSLREKAQRMVASWQ